MVGSNYSDALKAAGLATPGQLLQQWDYTGGVGGPIMKDRLWYYGTLRDEGQHRSIPGIFPNLNAGDPTKFTYAPDTTKQAQGAESFQLASIRLTAQITPRNKFNYHQDLQWPCNGSSFTPGGDGCRSQDRGGGPSSSRSAVLRPPGRSRGSWTSPRTNEPRRRWPTWLRRVRAWKCSRKIEMWAGNASGCRRKSSTAFRRRSASASGDSPW